MTPTAPVMAGLGGFNGPVGFGFRMADENGPVGFGFQIADKTVAGHRP